MDVESQQTLDEVISRAKAAGDDLVKQAIIEFQSAADKLLAALLGGIKAERQALMADVRKLLDGANANLTLDLRGR